jgi:hypothetical protein
MTSGPLLLQSSSSPAYRLLVTYGRGGITITHFRSPTAPQRTSAPQIFSPHNLNLTLMLMHLPHLASPPPPAFTFFPNPSHRLESKVWTASAPDKNPSHGKRRRVSRYTSYPFEDSWSLNGGLVRLFLWSYATYQSGRIRSRPNTLQKKLGSVQHFAKRVGQ